MGYIRDPKKPGGRYQAEVKLRGHPTLKATFDRKSDAKAWIQKTETDIRCGRHQLYAEGKRHTFAEAVDKYFQEQTVSVVKRGHLLWWKAEMGVLFIQDIRPALISEKKQKLLSSPTPKGVIRSKSTCNRYLASLSHIMSVCMKQWEWIGENPVRKIAREKEPRERTRFLSADERQRFLQACKESANPLLYTFVVLQLATGCRYNEIRWLRWPDIDFHNGRITITESKNGDMRTVPISGHPLELLRELSTKNPSLGFIFPTKNRAKPLELRRALRTAIRRSKLIGYRPHDGRHSFATEALARGLTLGEIGHLLGHRSPSVTKKYAHLTESRAAGAIAKMTDELFEGVQ